jgi:mannose-6-phosphate isomerase-like protein (cupin superfamily)
MDPQSFQLKALIETIEEPWSPIDVVEFNDSIVRLAKFEGEYHWHSHEQEDELFMVVEGSITIQLEGHDDIFLQEGQMGVVPKGVQHCPKSEGAYVLMFEPKSIS